MISADIIVLLGAGLVAGYVAGLVGIGGGFIFVPVLLFYYESIGMPAEVIPLLTVATSLLCTLFAALASGWHQYRRGAVDVRLALGVGVCSAVAVYLMTRFVTSQPWYTKTVFQLVFSGLLFLVAIRMARGAMASKSDDEPEAPQQAEAGWRVMLGVGSLSGVVSSAVGIGGGLVLVPAYNELLRLPMHRAVGTSSATIVLIALIGVLNYATLGADVPNAPLALGYVDVGRGLLLSLPAMLTARLGVWTAHRVRTQALRWSFAVLSVLLALRLLTRALG